MKKTLLIIVILFLFFAKISGQKYDTLLTPQKNLKEFVLFTITQHLAESIGKYIQEMQVNRYVNNTDNLREDQYWNTKEEKETIEVIEKLVKSYLEQKNILDSLSVYWEKITPRKTDLRGVAK